MMPYLVPNVRLGVPVRRQRDPSRHRRIGAFEADRVLIALRERGGTSESFLSVTFVTCREPGASGGPSTRSDHAQRGPMNSDCAPYPTVPPAS
jgi:hypothetical protein